MNALVFGYGYMGKIRAQILRRHPLVKQIFLLDPALDRADFPPEAQVLTREEEIPWDGLNAVFVCTPNNVTADLVCKGLRRVGNVFCEKPPGRGWEDFCRIEAAALERPQGVLAFGFNHRLHPSIRAARAMAGEGGLGEILYVKGTYGKSGGSRYRENWRNNPQISGGGILIDQGIHMLDLFHLFLGRLTLVDAVLTDSFWNCRVEDNAFLLLRSQEGVPAFLHSSATLWKHSFRLEIGCREGYLVASGLLSKSGSYGREQLVVGRRQLENETTALGNPREEIIHFDRDESWEMEVDEFLRAIQERRSVTHGTLEEARGVMEIIRDVYTGENCSSFLERKR